MHTSKGFWVKKKLGPETAKLALLLVKIKKYGIVQFLLHK